MHDGCNILIYLVISGLLDMRKLAGIFVINVVISVILMIIVSGKSSLAIQYMPWIVADCASVYWRLYVWLLSLLIENG